MVAQWRAPGRINLIGEHTDYNDGFVLPFALEAACRATVDRRVDGRLLVRSVQQGDEPVEVRDRHVAGWARYVAGPALALRARGVAVGGLDIAVDSSVPVGSGLSSSAAVVCSVTTALDDLLDLQLGDDELLAVARSAENDIVGAPTGGMDQLASLRCVAGHALFCDMRTLTTEAVPLQLAEAGLTVLVVDTRAEHHHADGEYGRRRAGCEQAAALLGVRALRDVGSADLDTALDRLPNDELRRYVRHVVTEDERVLQAVEVLRTDGPSGLGALLTASHASMRDDYRITIPELDLAVDTLLEHGALGARMTGGGFGGCVIGLLPTGAVDVAGAAVEAAFARHGHRHPQWFTVDRAAGGATRM